MVMKIIETGKQYFVSEREKLKGRSRAEIAEYIWDYYRLWLIALVALVLLTGFCIYQFTVVPAENWLYVCFANTQADLGNDSLLHRQYAEARGLNLKEKNLVFQAAVYCKPSQNPYTDSYYTTLINAMDSGTLDVLIMDAEELSALGASGRLLDLEGELLSSAFAERWQERFVYCTPYNAQEDGRSQIPIGIDLEGTFLVGENRPYPDGAAIGFGALSGHREEAEQFLEFVFDEETA